MDVGNVDAKKEGEQDAIEGEECQVCIADDEDYEDGVIYGIEGESVNATVPRCRSIKWYTRLWSLLLMFFGFENWMTYVFSIGVAIGGAAWAWLYSRSGNLYSAWISHAFVDAAIFWVGYDILFQ